MTDKDSDHLQSSLNQKQGEGRKMEKKGDLGGGGVDRKGKERKGALGPSLTSPTLLVPRFQALTPEPGPTHTTPL